MGRVERPDSIAAGVGGGRRAVLLSSSFGFDETGPHILIPGCSAPSRACSVACAKCCIA